jgi:hypothetical protein
MRVFLLHTQARELCSRNQTCTTLPLSRSSFLCLFAPQVLVALYEEPEKPANALDFIKQVQSCPPSSPPSLPFFSAPNSQSWKPT